MFSYNYLINNTLYQKVNSDKLKESIENSSFSSFLYIDTTETIIDIYFSSELDNDSILILNQIISEHDGNIYRFKVTNAYSSTTYLESLDYDILGLHKKRTIIAGELTQIDYYRNYDMQTMTYSDLVIRETRTYLRDEVGFPHTRLLNIYWYLENDGIGHSILNRPKYYDFKTATEEVVSRRQNLVAEAKEFTFTQLFINSGFNKITALTQSATFLANIGAGNSINLYIEGNGQALTDAIANCSLEFVTQDIKTGLANILIYNYAGS